MSIKYYHRGREMSIKYYHLAKDEELPEEFCAIRDEGGEPNGYVFYVPENEVAKLREFAIVTWELLTCNEQVFVWKELQELAHNLEIEVSE